MDNIHVWDAYGIETHLLVPRAIAEGIDLTPEKVEEIIEHNDEVEDKEKVLSTIYAKANSDLDEPNDIYSKDQHGMKIARRMETEELPDEVIDVIVKVGGLVEGWTPENLDVKLPK